MTVILTLASAACSEAKEVDTVDSSTVVTQVLGSQDELAAHMESCLAAAGFEVEVMPDGGIMMTYPNDQDEAASAARQGCLEGFPEYDPDPPAPTNEQLRELYSALLETKTCLEGRGIVVSDAPASDVFVENPASWHPYESVPKDLPIDSWYELNDECPQPDIE